MSDPKQGAKCGPGAFVARENGRESGTDEERAKARDAVVAAPASAPTPAPAPAPTDSRPAVKSRPLRVVQGAPRNTPIVPAAPTDEATFPRLTLL